MTDEITEQVVERYWQAMNTNGWQSVGDLLHADYPVARPGRFGVHRIA